MLKERIQYRLACTVMLWLLKGMCMGFGIAFGAIILWRVYRYASGQ